MSVRNQFLTIHSLEGNGALQIMFEVNIFQIDRYFPHRICGDGGFPNFRFFSEAFQFITPPLIFAILEKKIWILFLIFLLRNGTVHPLKSLVSLHVRKDNVKIYALLVISILSYLYLRQL